MANEDKPIQIQFNIPELKEIKTKKEKLEKKKSLSESDTQELFVYQSIMINNQTKLDYLSKTIVKTLTGEIFVVLKSYLTHNEWVDLISRYIEYIAEAGLVSGNKIDIWIEVPKQISFGIWVSNEDTIRICEALKIPSFSHMMARNLTDLPRDILVSKAMPKLIMRLIEFKDKNTNVDLNEYLLFFAWNIGEG